MAVTSHREIGPYVAFARALSSLHKCSAACSEAFELNDAAQCVVECPTRISSPNNWLPGRPHRPCGGTAAIIAVVPMCDPYLTVHVTIPVRCVHVHVHVHVCMCICACSSSYS